jgi:ribosomal protein S18 acetylase RimI-like enzyme
MSIDADIDDDISYQKLDSSFDLSNLDFTDDDNKDTDDLQAFIQNEAITQQKRQLGVTYVIIYQNQPIGYFTLATSAFHKRCVQKDKRPNTFGGPHLPAIVIQYLGIHKPNRSRKFGKWALQESFAISGTIAEKVGCRYLTLYVNTKNIRGIKFYEDNGFKKSEVIEDKKDYYMMYKDLFPELRNC